jgi:hypothetical protein
MTALVAHETVPISASHLDLLTRPISGVQGPPQDTSFAASMKTPLVLGLNDSQASRCSGGQEQSTSEPVK